MSKSVTDVVDVLKSLPPERVDEVYDFALFLQGRCRGPVDESDEWSDEDLSDVTAASLHYSDSQNPADNS